MKINEIAACVSTGDYDSKNFNISSTEYIISTIGVKIYGADTEQNTRTFFTKSSDGMLDAYVVISRENINGYHRLLRIRNYKNVKGIIVDIILTLLDHNTNLFIDKDEQLSWQGITWIKHFITKNLNKYKITDQNGDKISVTKLQKEWTNSNDNNFKPGSTSIFIEKY